MRELGQYARPPDRPAGIGARNSQCGLLALWGLPNVMRLIASVFLPSVDIKSLPTRVWVPLTDRPTLVQCEYSRMPFTVAGEGDRPGKLMKCKASLNISTVRTRSEWYCGAVSSWSQMCGAGGAAHWQSAVSPPLLPGARQTPRRAFLGRELCGQRTTYARTPIRCRRCSNSVWLRFGKKSTSNLHMG